MCSSQALQRLGLLAPRGSHRAERPATVRTNLDARCFLGQHLAAEFAAEPAADPGIALCGLVVSNASSTLAALEGAARSRSSCGSRAGEARLCRKE